VKPNFISNVEKVSSIFDRYHPVESVLDVLTHGRILSERETPHELLERVITTLFSVETTFGTPSETINKMAEELADYIVADHVMPGTPTLTNAGRYDNALSSCAVIPANLRVIDDEIEERICSFYRQNMGTGFEFTRYNNPVTLLNQINALSVRETATGKYDRYIGNMGLLHVSHPHIKEFIKAKWNNEISHFNISIDVTTDFMSKAEHGDAFTLSNGIEIDASDLLYVMAESAWHNGEPGLIYLERMNKDNPIEEIYTYVSTPPCAEMGLAAGETCIFGYINLQKLVKYKCEIPEIDYDKLMKITQLLTRVLDNAIEYSLPRYPVALSEHISKTKRRMGIGVCGLAEMLIALKLPYDSHEARRIARDVLSFINYISKCTSVELANQRGSCLAMNFPHSNKYISGRYLEEKFATHPSRTVSAQDWETLAKKIRSTRKLRNISTTGLPPTGRSSILLGATTSIEPIFSIFDTKGAVLSCITDFLLKELGDDCQLLEQTCREASLKGSFQDIEVLPSHVRECLKTAKEISSTGHLQMVADLAGTHGVVDDSASKTINLPQHSTIHDIYNIFLSSHHLGLKNIAVYRDNSNISQPVRL
jgi:ribonucleoside-diphosphate reductase alpha chain